LLHACKVTVLIGSSVRSFEHSAVLSRIIIDMYSAYRDTAACVSETLALRLTYKFVNTASCCQRCSAQATAPSLWKHVHQSSATIAIGSTSAANSTNGSVCNLDPPTRAVGPASTRAEVKSSLRAQSEASQLEDSTSPRSGSRWRSACTVA
jgi:hypothetical protein